MIELWMSGKRADIVEGAAEVILAARLERNRIQFPGHALFAEGQQRVLIWINADINRRLQRDSSLHSIILETSAEGAKDRTTRFFFGDEFRASHEAIRESHAVTVKPKGTNHPVAVEPVAITESSARESRGAIEIVGSANEIRDLALDILNDIAPLARFKREGAFYKRSVVIHPTPTSAKD